MKLRMMMAIAALSLSMALAACGGGVEGDMAPAPDAPPVEEAPAQ